MSIREKLKQREEARDKAAQGAGGGINAGLPEGVTRYIKAGELRDGRTLVLLAPYGLWYFYHVHEDGAKYPSRDQYFKKHTCAHSPHTAPTTDEEATEMFDRYAKPSGAACLSCKAKAKRKLYFMVPFYDPEYGTWRVFDAKEFHATKLMDDIDKLEKAAKKFDKDYSVVGDALVIRKADKTYAVEAGELDEATREAARAFIGSSEINYEELANFREEDEQREILLAAADEAKLDKAALGDGEEPDNPHGF